MRCPNRTGSPFGVIAHGSELDNSEESPMTVLFTAVIVNPPFHAIDQNTPAIPPAAVASDTHLRIQNRAFAIQLDGQRNHDPQRCADRQADVSVYNIDRSFGYRFGIYPGNDARQPGSQKDERSLIDD